jgi:hypothetical protein
VLGYRNTPAGPRKHPPWMTRPAGIMGGLAPRSRLPHGDVTARPVGPAGSAAAVGPRRCGHVPSDHPPAQASPLLFSPARNRSYTISPPKRY